MRYGVYHQPPAQEPGLILAAGTQTQNGAGVLDRYAATAGNVDWVRRGPDATLEGVRDRDVVRRVG